MQLLMILPAGMIHRHKSGIFKKSLRYAPLTLTYLASLIPRNMDIKLTIVDEGIELLDMNKHNPDLVCISIMTGTANRGYEIADYYRSRKIPVIIGGVHATLCPKEVKKHADSVVIGIAERLFAGILKDAEKNVLKPYYVDKKPLDADNMPIPSRHLLNKKHYITINSILATKGCPNNCQFCAVPYAWGKKYYTRPIDKVIEEIKTMDGREVVFIDVHLLADREYAIRLMNALTPLNKIWFGLTTTEAVNDKEIINALAKSGCRGLLIGFESVMEKTLASLNKSFNVLSTYKSLINDLHNAGIRVNGTFLFGTDEDTPDIFDKTVEVVDRLKIDLPRYSIFTPYPGTPVYSKLKKEGRIITNNWDLYDVEHVVFRPKHMSPEELEAGLHRAWEKTYSMGSIFKRISGTMSMWHLGLMTNLGYRYYASHLKQYAQFDTVK